MVQNNKINRYGQFQVLLCIIRAYVIFVVLGLSVLFIDCALFRDLSDKWFGFYVAKWAWVCILGPLNTVIIFLLFIAKINKSVLLKWKVTVVESLGYSLIAIFMDYINFIPKQIMNYSLLYPYIIIIPGLMMYSHIRK